MTMTCAVPAEDRYLAARSMHDGRGREPAVAAAWAHAVAVHAGGESPAAPSSVACRWSRSPGGGAAISQH